jgi:hypothetical protein
MAESPIGDDKKPRPTPLVDRAKNELHNRALLDTLATFFDRTYDTTKGAIRDRLRTLMASNALDRCLGGTSTIDLAKAMNAGKFIVFNLSAGILGDETSGAFGRFLTASVQNVAMLRQSQEKADRRAVFTFLDEADRFMSESIEKIYKETRKYGLHLAISQQITGYGMGEERKRAIGGNSFVRIAGASGDKETLRDLEDMTGVDRAELKKLPRGSFYIQRGNMPARKFTVSDFLMDGRNTMTAQQWEDVKAYQLAHYYAPYDAKKESSLGMGSQDPEKTHSGAKNGLDGPPPVFN